MWHPFLKNKIAFTFQWECIFRETLPDCALQSLHLYAVKMAGTVGDIACRVDTNKIIDILNAAHKSLVQL